MLQAEDQDVPSSGVMPRWRLRYRAVRVHVVRKVGRHRVVGPFVRTLSPAVMCAVTVDPSVSVTVIITLVPVLPCCRIGFNARGVWPGTATCRG